MEAANETTKASIAREQGKFRRFAALREAGIQLNELHECLKFLISRLPDGVKDAWLYVDDTVVDIYSHAHVLHSVGDRDLCLLIEGFLRDLRDCLIIDPEGHAHRHDRVVPSQIEARLPQLYRLIERVDRLKKNMVSSEPYPPMPATMSVPTTMHEDILGDLRALGGELDRMRSHFDPVPVEWSDSGRDSIRSLRARFLSLASTSTSPSSATSSSPENGAAALESFLREASEVFTLANDLDTRSYLLLERIDTICRRLCALPQAEATSLPLEPPLHEATLQPARPEATSLPLEPGFTGFSKLDHESEDRVLDIIARSSLLVSSVAPVSDYGFEVTVLQPASPESISSVEAAVCEVDSRVTLTFVVGEPLRDMRF